ncbi:hypothetical protein [Segetibacter aerophilus]|uniref:Uncharacterized protein n=1 Tax=Segetibacter aerophilus TaxID=670293 RepID=A0A512BGN8_9BACT|nr:hypothetical protein [Segetibacter aerophilus]GEO11126.1 hypothetical protein SAE01_36220 [Segetibacter aerophilus]
MKDLQQTTTEGTVVADDTTQEEIKATATVPEEKRHQDNEDQQYIDYLIGESEREEQVIEDYYQTFSEEALAQENGLIDYGYYDEPIEQDQVYSTYWCSLNGTHEVLDQRNEAQKRTIGIAINVETMNGFLFKNSKTYQNEIEVETYLNGRKLVTRISLNKYNELCRVGLNTIDIWSFFQLFYDQGSIAVDNLHFSQCPNTSSLNYLSEDEEKVVYVENIEIWNDSIYDCITVPCTTYFNHPTQFLEFTEHQFFEEYNKNIPFASLIFGESMAA